MTETQNHKSEEREVGSEVREEGAVEDVVEREIEAEEEEEEIYEAKIFHGGGCLKHTSFWPVW